MSNLEGQTLGKYQMLERLGRGGMADVYKAYQPGLDRYVAVKVLHPHLAEDADFITRFRREAQSVARLRHPHIIQVIDFDSQGDNYFMAMEFVEGGQSLKEYLQGLAARGERLPLVSAVGLASKLADALEYAHTEGMVHRDIKPANVLLPSLDKPLLGDFGIARIVGQTGLTAEGAMIGTPAYMSPEQGRGEKADERSDIYALGIILYELIANHPPYDADTPYGVILKHMNDPLVSPREFVADLPDSVERIVFKSLAKNPEDRYASAGEMRDALNQALAGLKDATQPSDSTGPVKVKAGAGRTQVAPVGGAAGATRLAGGQLPVDDDQTMRMPQTEPKPARKGLPGWALAVGALIVLAGVVGVLFATGALAGLLAGQSGGGATQVAAGGGQTGGAATEAVSGDLQAQLNNGYNLLAHGSNSDALAQFESLIQSNPNNPDVRAAQAIALVYDGQYDKASPIIKDLNAANVDTPAKHLANGLWQAWADGGDADLAVQALGSAIDKCADITPDNVSICLIALRVRSGLNQWHMDDHDAAFADIDRTVEISPDAQTKQASLEDRAELHAAYREWQAAADDIDASNAAVDGQASWILGKGAYYAFRLGDTARALADYDQLLVDSPQNANYLAGRGFLLYNSGNVDQAREVANLALEQEPQNPQAHYLLAIMARDEGDYDTALSEFDAVSNSPDAGDYDSQFFDTDLGYEINLDRARTLLAKGDEEGALAAIDKSLADNSYGFPYPYALRAQIYISRGETERARVELSLALQAAKDANRDDIAAEIQKTLDTLK